MTVRSDHDDPTVQALIIGPNPYQRAGIRSALGAAGICVAADTGEAAVAARIAEPADVMVLDGPAPLQVATVRKVRELTQERFGAFVALLGQMEPSCSIAQLLWEVRGLVNADGRPDELVSAVRCVHGGGLYVSAAFAGAVVLALPRRPQPHSNSLPRRPREALTPREREVIDQLCDGRPNAEIAGSLHISEKTVKFHVSNILAKYQFRSRAQLIAAIGMGALDQGPVRAEIRPRRKNGSESGPKSQDIPAFS